MQNRRQTEEKRSGPSGGAARMQRLGRRRRRITRWTVAVIYLLLVGTGSAAVFDVAQTAYEQGLRTNSVTYAEAIRLLGSGYRKALHKMEARARSARKLDVVRAVRAEIEHYILNAYVPDGENEDKLTQIRDLQKSFHRDLLAMLDDKDRGVLLLAGRYDTFLAGLERDLLGKSEFAAAREIRTQREQLRRRAEVLTARRSLGEGLTRLARLRRKPPVRPVPVPAPASDGPKEPREVTTPVVPEPVMPAPEPGPVPEPAPVPDDIDVRVRAQKDGRSSSKYYVGRWVWLPDRVWQREILVFNGAAQPSDDHRVWHYVRRMPAPTQDGRRPWDNFMYKKFSL